MIKKNRILNTLVLATLIATLQIINAYGQTRTGQNGEAILFGLHTLTAGQTMRLAVLNRFRVSDREIVPCIRVQIYIDIYQDLAYGNRLRFVRRLERTLTLDAGDALSFDFPTSRTGGERVSVSVFVRPEELNPTEPFRSAATIALEVVESGRTVFTLPGVIKGFDPQPDPPQAFNENSF